MCRLHSAGFTVATLKGIAFGPGLMVPASSFPVHFISITTRLRWLRLGPQSPIQVPAIGCPSWATIGATRVQQTKRLTKRTFLVFILDTFCDHEVEAILRRQASRVNGRALMRPERQCRLMP